MAEEATRRLLKVFGIAVTDFEETAEKILVEAKAAVEKGAGADVLLPLLARLLKAEGDLTSRWAEMTQLISATQGRAYTEILGLMEQATKR